MDTLIAEYPKERLFVLDVFRGLAVMAMVLVNNPGSWVHVYPALQHAKWHGFTFADVIFPCFLFVVGISLYLVQNRDLQSDKSNSEILSQMFMRALVLFGLGLFLALFYYDFSQSEYSWLTERLDQVRIMGVLQRIALVYLLAGIILLLVKQLKYRVICALLLLFCYWLLMTLVAYDDTDGKRYRGLFLYGNNLSAWVDSHVLGSWHVLYSKAKPFPFDPEGIFSTIPAVSTCLSGTVMAQYWFSASPLNNRALTLSFLAVTVIFCGAFLQVWVPINKAIWTPSFVLVTSGIAILTWLLISYLARLPRVKPWLIPAAICGINAIAMFMFSGILARIVAMLQHSGLAIKGWLYTQTLAPTFGSYLGSLVYALLFFLVCYGVMHNFYRKGWIVKV